MSKRLLYKNKIVRLYEEDIWGIFYKKQQRRELFLKKLKYLFFLNKLVHKIQNFYFYRKRFFSITKKYLKINLGLRLKKFKKIKFRYHFYDKRKRRMRNRWRYVRKTFITRNYYAKLLTRQQKKWKISKLKKIKKKKINKINKNNKKYIFKSRQFKSKKKAKYIKGLLFYKLLVNSRSIVYKSQGNIFYQNYNVYSNVRKHIYHYLLNIYYNKLKYSKKVFNIINNYNKYYNNKFKKKIISNIKTYLFNKRLSINKKKNDLKIIHFYFLYLINIYNLVNNIINKKNYNLIKKKKHLLSIFKTRFYKVYNNIKDFYWHSKYLKYLKKNLNGKKNLLKYLLYFRKYNNILIPQKKKKKYYYLENLQTKYLDFIFFKKILNKIFSSFLVKNNIFSFILFFKYIYNIKLIFIIKNLLILYSLHKKNFKYLKDSIIINNNNTKFNLKNLDKNNFAKLKTIFFILFFNFFNIIKKKNFYFYNSRKILFSFTEFNKWSFRRFTRLYLAGFSKYKKKKRTSIYYLLRAVLNFRRWLRRKVRRYLYKIKNFYYHKYNKFLDKDSLFAGKRFDIRKINLNFIKTDKDRKNNFILLRALENLKKRRRYHKNFDIRFIITKPNLSFSKTEYLLSFYASNKLYKFFRKLRVFYIKSMLLKRRLYLKKHSYKFINNKNAFLLKKYSKYINGLLDKITKKERFYRITKKKTALQKMFTLNLVPITKYVKKKSNFNSFYKFKIMKVWKIRKFYGCLTNYEFKRICNKAFKYQGDILIKFIVLLESRIDTLLYRTGMVSSIFEARQLINHNNIVVNNKIVNKRSFVLKSKDILSLHFDILNHYTNKMICRINNQKILLKPPIYLEVNYKLYMVFFLYDLVKVKNISYNFNLTGSDLNTILYYYY